MVWGENSDKTKQKRRIRYSKSLSPDSKVVTFKRNILFFLSLLNTSTVTRDLRDFTMKLYTNNCKHISSVCMKTFRLNRNSLNTTFFLIRKDFPLPHSQVIYNF